VYWVRGERCSLYLGGIKVGPERTSGAGDRVLIGRRPVEELFRCHLVWTSPHAGNENEPEDERLTR
jgi:hypothetical protein